MITAGFFAGLYFLGRQVRLRVDYIQSTSSLTGRKILLAPGMGGEKAPGSMVPHCRRTRGRGARMFQLKGYLLLLTQFKSLDISTTQVPQGRAQ